MRNQELKVELEKIWEAINEIKEHLIKEGGKKLADKVDKQIVEKLITKVPQPKAIVKIEEPKEVKLPGVTVNPKGELGVIEKVKEEKDGTEEN